MAAYTGYAAKRLQRSDSAEKKQLQMQKAEKGSGMAEENAAKRLQRSHMAKSTKGRER